MGCPQDSEFFEMHLRLVNDHDHAVLAVRSGGAVQPDGVGVVDTDGVNWDLAHGGAGGERNVTRVDAGHVLHGLADGLARVVEGRLCNGVVATHEHELNHVASTSGDFVGREDGSVLANADSVDGLSIDTSKHCQSGKGDGRELHF